LKFVKISLARRSKCSASFKSKLKMNVHLNLKQHDVLQFEIVRSSDSSNKYNRPSNNAHRATLY